MAWLLRSWWSPWGAVAEEEAAMAEEKKVEEKEATVAEEKKVEEKQATVAEEKEAAVAEEKKVEEKQATVAEEKKVEEKQATVAEEKEATVAEEKKVEEKEATVAEEKAAAMAVEEVAAVAEEEEAAMAEEKEADMAEEKKVEEKEATMAVEEEAAVAEEKETAVAEEKEAAVAEEKETAVAEEEEVVVAEEKKVAVAEEEEAALGKDEASDEVWEEQTTEVLDTEVRLILVGKSGGGKSATGNTILGRREFKSILAAKPVTLKCQREQGSWQHLKVSVVDTPDIFDSDDYNEIVHDQIRACIELSQPGPHALIFVTQVGRFTMEDAAAAKRIWNIFGEESARYTIVLFTCVEDLGGSRLDEYVSQSDNRNLQELIRRCGNRFCGFNNKATGAERGKQVSELMETVESTFVKNGGRYYVSRLYQEPNFWNEHIRMLREQNQWAGFNFQEMINSLRQYLLSFIYDMNADGGPPQLTTSTLTVQSSNSPEKRDL